MTAYRSAGPCAFCGAHCNSRADNCWQCGSLLYGSEAAPKTAPKTRARLRPATGSSPDERQAYLASPAYTGPPHRYASTEAQRDAYLASLDPQHRRVDLLPPGATLSDRLSQAEQMLEVCTQDAVNASQRYGELRGLGPELAEVRSLTPAQRHLYALRLAAKNQHERACRAYDAAKRHYDFLWAEWNAVNAPLPDRWPDDDLSLAWHEARADRSRRGRLR